VIVAVFGEKLVHQQFRQAAFLGAIGIGVYFYRVYADLWGKNWTGDQVGLE
jgi:hypothetical protein